MKIKKILEYKYGPSYNCETEKYDIKLSLFDYMLEGKISLNIEYREGRELYPETRLDPAEYEDNVMVGFCDYEDNDVEITKVIDPTGKPVTKGDYYMFEFDTKNGVFDVQKFMVKTVEQLRENEQVNELDVLLRDSPEDAAKIIASAISNFMDELEAEFEPRDPD